MCIGIPARIVECGPVACGFGGQTVARCHSRYGELQIDLSLVGPQPAGTWLLVFLDAAREVIAPERAAVLDAALDALAAAEAGATDFSAFFADLEREPRLPEFLRTPT